MGLFGKIIKGIGKGLGGIVKGIGGFLSSPLGKLVSSIGLGLLTGGVGGLLSQGLGALGGAGSAISGALGSLGSFGQVASRFLGSASSLLGSTGLSTVASFAQQATNPSQLLGLAGDLLGARQQTSPQQRQVEANSGADQIAQSNVAAIFAARQAALLRTQLQ